MLVLTRKEGEQIHIGDDIIVTVLEIQNDRVKLGIDAPKDVLVIRKELAERSTFKQQKSIPMKFTDAETVKMYNFVAEMARLCTFCDLLKQAGKACDGCRHTEARQIVERIAERRKTVTEIPRHHSNRDEPLDH